MRHFRPAYQTISRVIKAVKATRPQMDEFDLQAEREAKAISLARKLRPARSLATAQ